MILQFQDFLTLTKISTVINLGERPLRLDLGTISGEAVANFGKNILSPSNNLISLVGSLLFKKEAKSNITLCFQPLSHLLSKLILVNLLVYL